MLQGKIKFANKEYDSIEGILRAYYFDKKANSDVATYRGKFVCLDIEDRNESLYSNLVNQIEQINELLEVE